MAKKKTHKEFIDEMNLIHPDLKVLGEYINSQTKVLVEDSFGVKYLSTPIVLLKGKIPKNLSCLDKNNAFKKRGEHIHGIESFDYSLVDYKNDKTKVKIICPIHGCFEQLPKKHLKGFGCHECYKLNMKSKLTSNTSEFILKSKKIHVNKYDYSKVNYIGNKISVEIICSEHGAFKQTPNSHLNGRGCIKCSIPIRNEKLILDNNEFIIRAKKVHGDKYDYSLVDYKSYNKKVKIICEKHGIFEQIAYYHINGNGCQNCKISSGEEKIISYLINNEINFKKEETFKNCVNPKTGKKLKFDFYLSDYNTCIEYDGKQHFQEVKFFGGEKAFENRVELDGIKTRFCSDNNIDLLRIPYTEFSEIENLIFNFIKQKIG